MRTYLYKKVMNNKRVLMLMALIPIAFLFIKGALLTRVTDIDGNSYNTVNIGKQEWVSKDLNVSHFRNGDLIPEAEDASAWMKADWKKTPAWCYYNGDASYGKVYGKLYNWYAVIDPRGLAPKGWHIPTDLEWKTMSIYLGGDSAAGTKMKYTKDWDSTGNGTNESGFRGMPCGARNGDASFAGIGKYVDWWSYSKTDTVAIPSLGYNDGIIDITYGGDDWGACGFSVRCLKDY
jgi:uncharacterized protein (TIGR02145 family)